MRALLDRLYRASGVLAALFIFSIFAVVVTQVAFDAVNNATGWITGERSGLLIPSYAEFTGYFLCAASFLALAYALRSGSHIRITLAIRRLGGKWQLAVEVWCAGVGTLVSGYFTFFAVRLVVKSFEYKDVAIGTVAVPLWIPQTAMATGLVILTIAFADSLVAALRGELPPYADRDSCDGLTTTGREGGGA